jgi:hypothetical protein
MVKTKPSRLLPSMGARLASSEWADETWFDQLSVRIDVGTISAA